jgi:hypothetical protein
MSDNNQADKQIEIGKEDEENEEDEEENQEDQQHQQDEDEKDEDNFNIPITLNRVSFFLRLQNPKHIIRKIKGEQ